MKKYRILIVLLALVLALQPLAATVSATQAVEPQVTTAPVETTVPPETTLPVAVEDTMPVGFTGDASVEYGSRTLDAKKPLADSDDYTGGVKAALLYDLNSDTLVFTQNPDEKLYPASLTKVMTCLLALEMETDLEKIVTVTAAGLQGMEPDGSNAALQVDEQMSVRDLLYCLMVKSANDAGSVLAVHLTGSIDAFVEKMNQRAAEIGCTGTHFMNPHGLHHDEHYTTARDMAKILKEAMQYPLFVEIFTTKEYTVPATNLSEARELATTNFLMRSGGYPSVVDSRVIGGKTGYTSKAGRCLVALSEKNGMKLLSVVLGARAIYGEDGYSFIRYGNFEETSKLLDFAFKRYTTMLVLSPSQIIGQFSVSGGAHNAFGAIQEGMSAAVPIGSTVENIRYEYALTEGPLSAPLEKDTKIGVVRVWTDNICLAQQELRSASAVKVEEKKEAPRRQVDDNSLELWNTILIGALAILAVLFGFVLVQHFRAAAKRRRRRSARRKASARTGRGR